MTHITLKKMKEIQAFDGLRLISPSNMSSGLEALTGCRCPQGRSLPTPVLDGWWRWKAVFPFGSWGTWWCKPPWGQWACYFCPAWFSVCLVQRPMESIASSRYILLSSQSPWINASEYGWLRRGRLTFTQKSGVSRKTLNFWNKGHKVMVISVLD